MDIGMNGMEPEESPQRRPLSFVQGEGCYCAVDAPVALPEAEVFTVQYQERVQTQAAQGNLPSVRAVEVTIHKDRQHTALGRSHLATVHGAVHHSQ